MNRRLSQSRRCRIRSMSLLPRQHRQFCPVPVESDSLTPPRPHATAPSRQRSTPHYAPVRPCCGNLVQLRTLDFWRHPSSGDLIELTIRSPLTPLHLTSWPTSSLKG